MPLQIEKFLTRLSREAPLSWRIASDKATANGNFSFVRCDRFKSCHTKIICGVLTLIGSCMLLSVPLKKFLRKISPAVGIILSFVLFMFTRNINRRALGFGNFDLLVLPDFLYKNIFTAYLGFPPAGFFSTDYFSLLPWAFLFFCGYFLFSEANRYGLNERLFSKVRIPMLSFMGRHSLIIYLLHQPVLYGVCLGIEMFK